MKYSYEHIWFLLKAKTFLIHDHIMISDVNKWNNYKNHLQMLTVPTIQMMAALGQDKHLQPFDDGEVSSPPPPILEAVDYWMWCQSPAVLSTVATGMVALKKWICCFNIAGLMMNMIQHSRDAAQTPPWRRKQPVMSWNTQVLLWSQMETHHTFIKCYICPH